MLANDADERELASGSREATGRFEGLPMEGEVPLASPDFAGSKVPTELASSEHVSAARQG